MRRFRATNVIINNIVGIRHKSTKVIVTHNGPFHADEALAVYLLRFTPEFRHSHIVRTRNLQMFEGADAVIDVGGEYDPTNNRFDHHQRDFCEVFKQGVYQTKLSSAGLVYKHYGREILKRLLPLSESDVELVHDKLYRDFIEEIDAADNGISCHDGVPRYLTTSTISQRIARMNPAWNSISSLKAADSDFQKAIKAVGTEFSEMAYSIGSTWLPARDAVKQAIEDRMNVDRSGSIIALSQYLPWEDHLLMLEPSDKSIEFVIMKESANSNFVVRCVPKYRCSFESRRPLPLSWRGLRGHDLRQASSIPSAIFVHANGFVGVAQTYEGAVAMAKKAQLDTISI